MYGAWASGWLGFSTQKKVFLLSYYWIDTNEIYYFLLPRIPRIHTNEIQLLFSPKGGFLLPRITRVDTNKYCTFNICIHSCIRGN